MGGTALSGGPDHQADSPDAQHRIDPGGAVTAVILCGGAGRRVGFADKPLMQIHGRPLVEQVIERVRPQVGALLISANRNLDSYSRYGPVLRDTLPDFAGPLAGILAGLEACTSPWLLACAGDAPGLPRDLVRRFREALAQAATTGCPMAIAASDDGQLEPLPLLLHCSTRDSLESYLATGRRSVYGWFATLASIQVDFPGAAAAFASLNTPEDFDPPG